MSAAVSAHEAWLQQARRDLDAASHLAGAGFHEQACFCSQQAAEKAIKALSFALGITPPVKGAGGHDLGTLLSSWEDLLAKDDPALATAHTELQRHEQDSRYPKVVKKAPAVAPADVYDKTLSDSAIRHAKLMVAFCEPLAAKLAGFRSNL